jgi:hypothetical protein
MIILLIINIILLIILFGLLFITIRAFRIGIYQQYIEYIKTKIDIIDGDDTFIMKEIKKIQYKQQNDYNSLYSVLNKQQEKLNKILTILNNRRNK